MPESTRSHSEREPVITLRSAAEHLSSRLTLNPNPVELENAADLLLHFATRLDALEEQLEAAQKVVEAARAAWANDARFPNLVAALREYDSNPAKRDS